MCGVASAPTDDSCLRDGDDALVADGVKLEVEAAQGGVEHPRPVAVVSPTTQRVRYQPGAVWSHQRVESAPRPMIRIRSFIRPT